MENSEEKIVNILIKIDMIISMIDKLNSKRRLMIKNSEFLGLDFIDIDEMSKDTFVLFSNFIKENLENNNNIYDRLKGLESSLDTDFDSIENDIEVRIKTIDESQSKAVYQKAIQLIYVAKWQNLQKEKEYYLGKVSLFDKLTGKARANKMMIDNLDLKSDLVKKEFYEIKDDYSGQGIRETLNIINTFENKNNALIEFKEKLIKAYMIDEATLSTKTSNTWKVASLLPTGFFEQRKYYKILIENIAKENLELRNKLNVKFIKETKDEKKVIDKIQKLAEMNIGLKNILNNI